MKDKYFLLVVLAEGLVWLKSSIGKFSAGGFVEGMGATLGKFIVKNPNFWYVDFIKTVAIPNANLFGMMVLWGELFVALTLVLGSAYLLMGKKLTDNVKILLGLGLFGGLLMNLNFYFAAGWMSSSTESLNLLMAAISAVGLWFVAKDVKINS